jgi:tetratricopeptide (TPR) repeat protein
VGSISPEVSRYEIDVVRRAFLSLFTSVSLSFVATHAGAEPTSPPADTAQNDSDPGRVARARALFDEGVSAYAAGRYYEAIERFSETARLYPNQQLAFNIAKAYDNLGNRSLALRFYREYLRSSANPPDGAIVNARVEELEHALAQRGIQQLSISSDPPGATVLLDGEPVGLTPWTGETWPGSHRVELRRAGFAPEQSLVELEAHRAKDLELELDALPAAPMRRSRDVENDNSAKQVRVVTWVALAAATATLGTAIVVEVADDRERRGLAPLSAFFAGVGTAAAAAGGVLLYLDLNTPGSGDHAVSLAPAPGGALATYHTAF